MHQYNKKRYYGQSSPSPSPSLSPSTINCLFFRNYINDPSLLCRIFLAQIQLHQRNAAERWNYDFVKDRPIVSADSKYMWERVPPVNSGLSALVGLTGGQAGPSVITLSNAAHVREVVGPALDVDRVPAPSSPNSSSASDSDLLMDSRADLSLDIDQNSIGSNAKRVKAEQVVVAVAGSSGTGPTCCTRQLRQKKMTGECLGLLLVVILLMGCYDGKRNG